MNAPMCATTRTKCTTVAAMPIGEQFEDDLNTADHDEEDTVGEEKSPPCCRHRLTIGT